MSIFSGGFPFLQTVGVQRKERMVALSEEFRPSGLASKLIHILDRRSIPQGTLSRLTAIHLVPPSCVVRRLNRPAIRAPLALLDGHLVAQKCELISTRALSNSGTWPISILPTSNCCRTALVPDRRRGVIRYFPDISAIRRPVPAPSCFLHTDAGFCYPAWVWVHPHHRRTEEGPHAKTLHRRPSR